MRPNMESKKIINSICIEFEMIPNLRLRGLAPFQTHIHLGSERS
jgi:hypothetical protein